ncbi:MAG TPA: hypothetical protein VJZ72_00085 [Candidatus Limnocylindrales bacterium]|nr:hypothetical protein [Candidatus Limnocylindrales bacterium]
MAGRGSVSKYAIQYVGGGRIEGATSGGGNALLAVDQHALDGPEHTAKSDLHSPWTLVAGGRIAPTAGDPPTGEVVLQVKTSAGAPTHAATRGTPCLVAPDERVYVNLDGATDWMLIGGIDVLDDLADVDTTGKSDGDVLTWSSGTSTWIAAPPSTVATLDDLTDVAITAPVAGQRLRYDGSGWANTDLVWRPVMVEDPGSGNWYVVVTGDGDAVMVEA